MPELLTHTLIPAAILSVFVSVIAYIHSPRAKTLIFSMPIPFTCAYLATRMPINSTHIVGLILVTLYHWIVWGVYLRMRRPLSLAIALGVTFYIGTAALLGPMQAVPFYWTWIAAATLWALAVMQYRPINEPGHRSTAPWYLKMPLIFTIAVVLFSMTRLLSGAVTTFPYAGVFTSYEMRHSPRTLAGQYTINNASFLLMFGAIWWLEPRVPQPIPLLVGWSILLVMLGIIYRTGVGRPKEPVPAGE